jgi:hypothetical protein
MGFDGDFCRAVVAAIAVRSGPADHLQTMNGLYTVYSNLIVFDHSRRIVAVSAEDSRDIEGTVLDEEWASRILSLRGDQAYAVSSFAATHLYKGRPTYIYGAAIADPKRQAVVGGVAIVFDSEPQFAAMLTTRYHAMAQARSKAAHSDCSSRRKERSFPVWTISCARVIRSLSSLHSCSSRQATAIMASRPSAKAFMPLVHGLRWDTGSTRVRDDAYRNNIVALIVTPLCDVGAQASEAQPTAIANGSDQMRAGIKEEIATHGSLAADAAGHDGMSHVSRCAAAGL